MSEEQPIFVSSEDDLADVRERLAKITSRKVTLVIPSQTRLHSPVAWKLLHRDARQLGKDILIVSTDPQVRSVAQSVKFRVAHSLESSPSGKAMPGSRPSRSAPVVKGRGAAQSRALHPQPRSASARRSMEQGLRGPSSGPMGGQAGPAEAASHERPPAEWYEPLSERQEPKSEGSDAREAVTGGLSNPSSSTFEVFESNDPMYGAPSYDHRIHTSPPMPIHPLPAAPIEEPNLLQEDFKRAQDIRQAALQGGEQAPATPDSRRVSGSKAKGADYRPTPLPKEADDPFVYMEDAPLSPAPEQRGAVSIEGFDTTEHTMRDVSEFPTSVIEGEIVYEGDQGDFVMHSDQPSVTRAWDDYSIEDDDPSPRVYGMRPRNSRSGRMPPPEETHAKDALPPLEERMRQVSAQRPRPASQRPQSPSSPLAQRPQSPSSPLSQRPRSSPLSQRPQSSPLSPRPQAQSQRPQSPSSPLAQRPQSSPLSPRPQAQSQRPQQPLVMPTSSHARDASPAPASAASGNTRTGKPPAVANRADAPATRAVSDNRKPASPPARRSGTAQDARTGRSPRPAASQARRNRRGSFIWTTVAILLVLIAGALAYFGPSADVTITLPSVPYAHDITVNAATSQPVANSHTVPASVLTSSAITASGTTFKATGTRQVGNAGASGQIVVTNNMAVKITIPSGTIFETAENNPIQFITTAEAVVAKGPGTLSPTIPVDAQQKGIPGNVDARTITVIPSGSLQAIATANSIADPATVKLLVTNPAPSTGGGTISQPYVTDSDLQAAYKTLQDMLQNQLMAWKPTVSGGDLPGKPYAGSVGSFAQMDAPKSGADAVSGTFIAKLSGKAAVLVVHQVALQDVARNELSAELNKDSKLSRYMLYTDPSSSIAVSNVRSQSGNNNTTLTLTFNASGVILPRLTAEQVQNMIIGKSLVDARDTLANVNNIPNVQQAFITINPSFVNWVPFWTGHIYVHIKPGSSAPAGK